MISAFGVEHELSKSMPVDGNLWSHRGWPGRGDSPFDKAGAGRGTPAPGYWGASHHHAQKERGWDADAKAGKGTKVVRKIRLVRRTDSYTHMQAERMFRRGIAKKDWKSWYPAPPGTGKIPNSRLSYSNYHGMDGVDVTARVRRSATKSHEAGSISVGPTDRGTHSIAMVGTHEHLRRRGVATNLQRKASQVVGQPIEHSPIRTPLGDKFAEGESRRRGTKPPANADAEFKRKPADARGTIRRKHMVRLRPESGPTRLSDVRLFYRLGHGAVR